MSDKPLMMMCPVKVAGLDPAIVARVAARALQMQGLPEVRYKLINAAAREAAERGTYNVLCALESLGFELLGPAQLSPILEVPQ